MSSGDGDAARTGAAFRLLMKLRVLVGFVGALLLPWETVDLASGFVIVSAIALSGVALAGWERISPALARHPTLVALDVVVSYAVLAAGGVLGPFFLHTVVTSVLAGLLLRWPGATLISVLQALLYLVSVTELGVAPTFQTFIGTPLFYFVGAFAGSALRRLLADNAALAEARRAAEVAAAAAEERARLAREMHDSVAKTLRGIALAAGALPGWVAASPERAADRARQVAAAADTAFEEVRALLTDLRRDAGGAPLAAVVGELARAWGRSAGVAVAVRADPAAALPPAARHEALSILREALDNVARHAAAERVEVVLELADGTVALRVSDDGRGFATGEDAARTGRYGIVGMRERAARAGAALELRSAPGAGTVVALAVPVAAREVAA
ncbi:sensor histidine kinase [Actinomadura atramentaria]|uniref:sensor histidine kinase n=1 Tax=Actinomadura atramentaria TaxID=1990 RepID=UPI00036B24E8|nr:histidine kinase [Actinomadura atramentaria]